MKNNARFAVGDIVLRSIGELGVQPDSIRYDYDFDSGKQKRRCFTWRECGAERPRRLWATWFRLEDIGEWEDMR